MKLCLVSRFGVSKNLRVKKFNEFSQYFVKYEDIT